MPVYEFPLSTHSFTATYNICFFVLTFYIYINLFQICMDAVNRNSTQKSLQWHITDIFSVCIKSTRCPSPKELNATTGVPCQNNPRSRYKPNSTKLDVTTSLYTFFISPCYLYIFFVILLNTILCKGIVTIVTPPPLPSAHFAHYIHMYKMK